MHLTGAQLPPTPCWSWSQPILRPPTSNLRIQLSLSPAKQNTLEDTPVFSLSLSCTSNPSANPVRLSSTASSSLLLPWPLPHLFSALQPEGSFEMLRPGGLAIWPPLPLPAHLLSPAPSLSHTGLWPLLDWARLTLLWASAWLSVWPGRRPPFSPKPLQSLLQPWLKHHFQVSPAWDTYP